MEILDFEQESFALKASVCFDNSSDCPDRLSECFERVESKCSGEVWSSRYDNASASYVVYCAILMFFMRAGFLYLEESFSKSDKVFRRRVVLAKYIDIFAGTFGFWLFGYAISGNTNTSVLGEQQDYIFWFFRFTFASNTATILGGTLVGQKVQLRTIAIFVYSFIMTAFIHPSLARFFWSASSSDPRGITWSPYAYCNGTFTGTRSHEFSFRESMLVDFTFIDFSGSGVVHLCGGIGAFVLALFHKLETVGCLKKVRECGNCAAGLMERKITVGMKKKTMTVANSEAVDTPESAEDDMVVYSCKPTDFLKWMYPSCGGNENVESAALGILILWTTWFAFNAGSTESISGKATHAAVGRIALVMCLACASAGIVQAIVCGLVQIYKRDENFNVNEIANVILGALVAVTGCCPFIYPPFAIIIGVLTVLWYHLGCLIEYRLRLHDGGRVFPVHGICGFWGVLCVGIFSKSCLIHEIYDNFCFCVTSTLPEVIDNQGLLFAYQLAGGLFILAWSFVLCSAVFLIMWIFPIKFVFACLPKIFCFDDPKRGIIEFNGSLLFTHFDEIGPKDKPDESHTQSLAIANVNNNNAMEMQIPEGGTNM